MSRLTYVDDSGSVDHGGLIVYGWVSVAPQAWRLALRDWLELRKGLFTDFGIPVSQELHGTEFVNGRGRVSVNPPARFTQPAKDGAPAVVLWKDLGREVAQLCLQALGNSPHVRVGAVYHWATGLKGSAYAQARYEMYGALLRRLDEQLRAEDSYGFITMDGQDTHYREAHRALKLDSRHIVEDPAFHDSRHSQWVQMADLVAYTANVHLNQHAGNEFGWSWYPDHLGGSDSDGAPVALDPQA